MPGAPAIEAPLATESTPRPTRVLSLYPWLVVTVLVAAAALLYVHALGQKSVWIDEGVSIEMARLDWYNFVRILWRHEANMVLHTLLLRFWLLFGASEGWARTPSVLAALATIPAVFVLGRKLFDARVGLMASFLLTINAFHIRYAQEARSYSLFAFLCVFSCIYFLKFVEDPSRANRKGHVLTSVLAVYTHFFAGLLIVAQWLSLKVLDRKQLQPLAKKSWRQIGIAIIPLIVFVATTGLGVLRWIPRPGLTSLYITSIYLTGGGGSKLVWLYLGACAIALLPVVPSLFRYRRLSWEAWRYTFVALWLLFPIAAAFLLSQWKPCFLARYFIFTLPALVLLTAAGIARLHWRLLMAGVLLLFGAWSLPAVNLGYSKDIDVVREDFRAATKYILANAETGDAILFYQPIGRMPYEYYRSLTAASAYPTVVYPEHGGSLTFKDFYAGRPPDAVLTAIASHYRRVWIVLTHNIVNGAPDATTAIIDSLFASQYPGLVRKEFQQIDLHLYCRGDVERGACSGKRTDSLLK
ncbi:MAG TPA: glycosyltransferase family 39 protein [Terriglobales bacterium]|nr:glycosyltransferase family 39 protein [Terriglobales bacterium]